MIVSQWKPEGAKMTNFDLAECPTSEDWDRCEKLMDQVICTWEFARALGLEPDDETHPLTDDEVFAWAEAVVEIEGEKEAEDIAALLDQWGTLADVGERLASRFRSAIAGMVE